MWRGVFIGITVLLIYFSYGIAAQGGVWSFFVGAAVGAVVTYLFLRARQEAAANANINTQNVSVNLNQHKLAFGNQSFTEEQYVAIAELVDRMNKREQLVQQSHIPLRAAPIQTNGTADMTRFQRLAQILKEREEIEEDA